MLPQNCWFHSLLSICIFLLNFGSSQNSVGQLGDGSTLLGAFKQTARFFYASPNPTANNVSIIQPDNSNREIYGFGTDAESLDTNALGDDQVLFYDYFAPQRYDELFNTITVIYIHGGGYQSGSANSYCRAYAHLEEWLQYGFHGISIEYRRGWFGDGSDSPGEDGTIPLSDAERLDDAIYYAVYDVNRAWEHYNNDTASGHGRWFTGQSESQTFGIMHEQAGSSYIVIGTSAGASVAAIVLATEQSMLPRDDINVLGAVLGYGTIRENDTVLGANNNIPMFLVGGMFDETIPFYDNHAYLNENTTILLGVMRLYESLVANNFSARMLINAQGGHSWGRFGKTPDSSDDMINYCSAGEVPDFITNIVTNNASTESLTLDDILSMPLTYALRYFFEIYIQNASVIGNIPRYYEEFRFNLGSPLFISGNEVIDGQTYVFPDINDVNGDIYEDIHINGVTSVFTVDPAILGETSDEYIEIDGFDYGCDVLNGLGELGAVSGFRYEPIQTEIETALERFPWTVSDIYAKYNVQGTGTASTSYNESSYTEDCSDSGDSGDMSGVYSSTAAATTMMMGGSTSVGIGGSSSSTSVGNMNSTGMSDDMGGGGSDVTTTIASVGTGTTPVGSGSGSGSGGESGDSGDSSASNGLYCNCEIGLNAALVIIVLISVLYV